MTRTVGLSDRSRQSIPLRVDGADTDDDIGLRELVSGREPVLLNRSLL